MILVENISKRFKKLNALDDVSGHFEKGQVVSLIGPNGSGKTTLIKSILGMVKPDKGKILVEGEAISNDYAYKGKIGYMPQIGRYPDNMKVGQLFRMMQDIRNATDDSLDRTLIRQFDLVKIFEKPMRILSGGTRQRVSAALAFLFDPDILILDEPTAGLDPLSSEILKEKILVEKSKNKLILITSHILSDLEELTTHIMYMQDGKVVFFKSMESLLEETGELKLSKAIARVMKGKPFGSQWNGKLFALKSDKKNP